jgi:ABC-type sugar transport system substrate-binding protein
MDRRRFLVASLAGALGTPLVTLAQQAERVFRVGLLSAGVNSHSWRDQYKPLLEALRELNYVEGRNLVITPAFGDGKAERLTALVTGLVNAKVDVIVSSGLSDTQRPQCVPLRRSQLSCGSLSIRLGKS